MISMLLLFDVSLFLPIAQRAPGVKDCRLNLSSAEEQISDAGRSLANRIDQNGFTASEQLQIVARVCQGLATASLAQPSVPTQVITRDTTI